MEKEQEKKRYIEFDAVFDIVNTFGFYQNKLYWFVSCLKLPMVVQFGFLVFALGTPSFRCTSSTIANITCPIKKCCENCTSYAFKDSFTSIVKEWNLICDRAYIAAAIQSSYFVGMLVGSAIGGHLSDSFGRKKCIFINCFVMVSVFLGSAFADSYILSCVLRFAVGFSQISLMVSQYTFLIELVGPKKRTLAANATEFVWTIGALFFVMIAYLLPKWRHTVIAGNLVGFVFPLFYRVFPESPRWLVANGHLDEAHAVLMKYGSKTKQPIDEVKLMTLLKNIREEQLTRPQHAKKYHILDMFKTPRLRRWSLIVCFNWFVISLVYFALILFVSQLTGNIFINVIMMELAEIPSRFISWIVVLKFGRRLPFFTFNVLAGIMLFSFTFVPKKYAMVTTALAILGKSFMAVNFDNVFLITSELYPTVIRNIAIGTGSMTARCGAILTPYFVMMTQFPGISITFPMCIFGGLAIVAAIAALFLPETLFANMHQSIEETEEVVLHYSIPCCGKPTGRMVKEPHAEKEDLTAKNSDDIVEAVATV